MFLRLLPLALCLGSILAHAAEEVTVPVEGVHLCCDDCEDGVRAVVTAAGATKLLADQGSSRLVIFAPDTATAQKALRAMIEAGYYGRSNNPAVPATAETGAKDAKVKGTEIEGVHLCCSSCVEQAKGALLGLPGITDVVAAPNAPTLQIRGEFNEKAALDALLEVGFAGKVVGKK